MKFLKRRLKIWLENLLPFNLQRKFIISQMLAARYIIFFFFIQYNLIPVYYQWIVWLSPFSYAYTAAALNEFVGSPDAWWLKAMGLYWQDKWGNFCVLIMWVIVFRFLQYVKLVQVSAQTRRTIKKS